MHNSKKRMNPKPSNLVQEMTLGHPTTDFVLGQQVKGQGHTGSQSTKPIEGDRVAGVSLQFCRVITV